VHERIAINSVFISYYEMSTKENFLRKNKNKDAIGFCEEEKKRREGKIFHTVPFISHTL